MDTISKIFLEMEADIGTRDLATEVLLALRKAVKDVRLLDDKQFFKQFYSLLLSIKNTQPRIGLILDDFYQIWKAIEKEKKRAKKSSEKASSYDRYLQLKSIMLDKIDEIIEHDTKDKKKIIALGRKEITNGDIILLHSHSKTVLDILRKATCKKKFTCIIAEQEYGKTQQVIYALNKAKIPFSVVPEYMLSHIEDMVTKVFLGGVTINSFRHVVGDAGSNALVSEFQGKVPIYLFLTTSKCSFWKAQSLHHSFKEKQVRSHIFETFTYKRIKYSHDRVPLEMFDFVVTEKQKFTAEEMLQWYTGEFKKRSLWRKTFIKER